MWHSTGGRARAKAGGLGSWPGTRAELGRWPAVSAFRACCGGQESARPADWAWDRASVSGRLREQWPEPTKRCGREASRLFTHDAVGAAAAWASPSAVRFPGEGAGARCHLRCWPPGSGEGPQGLLMASYDPRVAQAPPSSGALPSQSPHPPTRANRNKESRRAQPGPCFSHTLPQGAPPPTPKRVENWPRHPPGDFQNPPTFSLRLVAVNAGDPRT